MKLNFSGSFEFDIPREKVFDFITDPTSIGGCISDLEKLEIIDSKNFNARMKVGVGFVRGSFDLKCSILELNRPLHSKILIDGSGVPGKMKAQISFDLQEKSNNSTQINWIADAEISGLISGLGETIVRRTTETKVQEILANIKQKLLQK